MTCGGRVEKGALRSEWRGGAPGPRRLATHGDALGRKLGLYEPDKKRGSEGLHAASLQIHDATRQQGVARGITIRDAKTN